MTLAAGPSGDPWGDIGVALAIVAVLFVAGVIWAAVSGLGRGVGRVLGVEPKAPKETETRRGWRELEERKERFRPAHLTDSEEEYPTTGHQDWSWFRAEQERERQARERQAPALPPIVAWYCTSCGTEHLPQGADGAASWDKAHYTYAYGPEDDRSYACVCTTCGAKERWRPRREGHAAIRCVWDLESLVADWPRDRKEPPTE